MADATPNTTVPPEEGFLHSIATSIGVDPEAVKSAAKSFYDHPVDSAQAVGSEAVDEISDAAKHPIETAKTAGKGVVAAVTNPDAQVTAKTRFAQPGVSNKLAGIGEYLTSGVPLVGGNLVKSEEQAARGNVAGSSGTLLGTIAPALLDTEGGQAVKTHLADTARTAVDSIKTEGKAALEAKAPAGSPEAGFLKLDGKPVLQGGHAGGGVASVEEINRPGRFVKVSKSGQLTDQGKTPDFNLRNGEVGYQVKPDGTYEVKDGQESPAHTRAIQQYAKTIFPVKGDLSSAYGATGKALNVISPSYPTARRDAVPDFISKAPEGKLAQDAPAAAKVKQFVEDNGGVFRGMQVDKVGDKRIGLVHFDVPPEMVGGKKNVTASISIDKATPAGIKAKVAEMAAKHQ